MVKGTQGEGGHPPACASQRPHSGDHRNRIYVTVGDWGFHYHVIGYMLPWVIGGSIITERISGLPGLGHLLIQSINERDYTVISGITILVAIIMVLAILVIDLTYAYLDPRIRYR